MKNVSCALLIPIIGRKEAKRVEKISGIYRECGLSWFEAMISAMLPVPNGQIAIDQEALDSARASAQDKLALAGIVRHPWREKLNAKVRAARDRIREFITEEYLPS